jgi:hypothetical protein
MGLPLTYLPVVITLQHNLTTAELASYNPVQERGKYITQLGPSIEPGQGQAVGLTTRD